MFERLSREAIITRGVSGAAALALAGTLSGCNLGKPECDVVGTFTIDQVGQTVWENVAVPLSKKHDQPIDQSMAQIASVNPDLNPGQVQIPTKINVPGNCR